MQDSADPCELVSLAGLSRVGALLSAVILHFQTQIVIKMKYRFLYPLGFPEEAGSGCVPPVCFLAVFIVKPGLGYSAVQKFGRVETGEGLGRQLPSFRRSGSQVVSMNSWPTQA